VNGETPPEPAHYRLDVWKASMRLVKSVYEATESFPDDERFGLTSQIRRSAISVPSNIAEGAARGTPAEFVRFLQISRASLMELDTQLLLGKDLGLLKDFRGIREHVLRILAMLNGLIRHKSQ
jgi:four helix bundle protein